MDILESVRILLVDDDRADQKLIKNAFSQQNISSKISVVEKGQDALDYLSRSKANDSDCPRPDLILLDLNMPGVGGKECLRHIKADDQLDTIPVVILSTSDFDDDIIECYKLHASGYIKKPVAAREFQEVMRMLGEYWFIICKRVSPS